MNGRPAIVPAGELLPGMHAWRRIAMIATGAGWIMFLLALVLNPDKALAAYLWAFLFWLGISLGSMALVMLHHLTGGAWGLALRRIGEAAALCLPLMAVLFIPLALGVFHLYPWADAAAVAADPILQHKSIYLNWPFWLTRAAIYFAIWITLAVALRAGSVAYDSSGREAIYSRLRGISAAGILIYIFSMTFAGVDWVMSREPHWYSTIFGFVLVIGQALNAMAFMVFIAGLLSNRPPLKDALSPPVLNDLGNLFLTLVILWAYMSLSQFLVSWMGNIAEDAAWYVPRTRGFLGFLGAMLILCHFMVPFFLLLSRDNKRHMGFLGRLAIFLLVMRAIDLFWTVRPTGVPADRPDGHESMIALLGIADLAAPLAIGGLWMLTFFWRLSARPLLPQRDPAVTEMLVHGEHAHSIK
jgi:hypothetical protein